MKTKVEHNIEYRFPERETQISSYFKKSLEVTFLNNGRMQTTNGRLTTQVVQKGQLSNSQISSLNNESLTHGTKIKERRGN